MTVQILLDSTVSGTLDEVLGRAGLFVGQRGFATDFGKVPRLLPLRWDGTDWDFETEYAPGMTAALYPCPGDTAISSTGVTLLNTGTLAAAPIADTNVYTRIPRVDISATGVAGFRENLTRYFRGTTAGSGGFFLRCKFGIKHNGTTITAPRAFFGLRSNTGAPTDVDPSTYSNLLGLGYDLADSTWSFMHKTGSGAVTKNSLSGMAKPSADTAYEAIIFCAPNGSDVRYVLRNLMTGSHAMGSATTSLPAGSTTLCWLLASSVAGSGTTAAISLMSLFSRIYD